MISGKLAKNTGMEDEDDLGDTASIVSSPIKKRKDVPAVTEEETTLDRPASLASNKSRATTVASHQSQLKKSETVPLTGLNLRDAVTYLIRYLTDKRQKLARRLNTGSTKAPSSDDKSSSVNASVVDEDDILYQASLVDTSLLKSYMMTNDALVGPLLRVQNHCDVEECEIILMDKKVSMG
jgi:hypothetical protein